MNRVGSLISGRPALWLNYAGMISLAMALNLMPIFLTTVGADFGGEHGLSNEQLGRIPAFTFFGLVLGILVSGPLADRLGFKPFAVLGNVLVSGGLLILGTSNCYEQVLVASLVMGVGAGVLDMVLSPIVCALDPDRKTAAMNWLHSFYCTGAVLTVLLAASALHHGFRWQTLALWMVVPTLLVGMGFVSLVIPSVQHGRGRMRLRDLMRRRFFLLALVAILMGGATELGMAQWMPAYAERQLGFSAWTAGLAFMGFSVAMALGRIAAGLVGSRVKPHTLLRLCCWSSVGLFIVACMPWWPRAALTACILAGLAGSCLWPSLLGVTADRYPRGGASMFGMLSAFGNAGGIVMPWLVGAVADRSTLAHGLVTSSAAPLLMALLLSKMRRLPAEDADGC